MRALHWRGTRGASTTKCESACTSSSKAGDRRQPGTEKSDVRAVKKSCKEDGTEKGGKGGGDGIRRPWQGLSGSGKDGLRSRKGEKKGKNRAHVAMLEEGATEPS